VRQLGEGTSVWPGTPKFQTASSSAGDGNAPSPLYNGLGVAAAAATGHAAALQLCDSPGAMPGATPGQYARCRYAKIRFFLITN